VAWNNDTALMLTDAINQVRASAEAAMAAATPTVTTATLDTIVFVTPPVIPVTGLAGNYSFRIRINGTDLSYGYAYITVNVTFAAEPVNNATTARHAIQNATYTDITIPWDDVSANMVTAALAVVLGQIQAVSLTDATVDAASLAFRDTPPV
jgi:hypothetical protein